MRAIEIEPGEQYGRLTIVAEATRTDVKRRVPTLVARGQLKGQVAA